MLQLKYKLNSLMHDFVIVSGEVISTIKMETNSSITSARQSRGLLRVPRAQRKMKTGLVENVMDNPSRNPKDEGQSLKRKVENAQDMIDSHVKLVKLSQKEMDKWSYFNSEMMHLDGDLQVDTFQQLKLNESTPKNKTDIKTDHANPKPVIDKPVREMKDSRQRGSVDEHPTVVKKSNKNNPKPKLNIQIAPLVKQTVLNKVKPVSVVSKMFSDKFVPSKGPCDKVVPNKGPCDKVVPNKGPCDKVLPNKGPCDKVVPSKGPCDTVVPNKGPYDKVVLSNGSCDKVVPSKGPCDKVVPSKGSCDKVVPSKGSCDKVVPTCDSSDLVIQVKPLAKSVTSDFPKEKKRPVKQVSAMSGHVRSKNLGSVNNILLGESKEKLIVKLSPTSGKVVKRSTPKKIGNVKKLKLFWENFTVKAKAVGSTSAKPSEEARKQDDSTATGKEIEQVTDALLPDSQAPSTSQHDDAAELPEPQTFRTPTKTPAMRATPATPKSPQELLQDYTKTVEVSKSKSPSFSSKSSKLAKFPHELECESPGKWAKKSFRRLFPDPPANEEPSPDALDLQKSRKKRSTKKRSLMSLDPSIYSQFFSPPPADLDSSMATQRPASNRSIEVSRSVADDSFIVWDVSVEDSVALPNQPSCVDSLNGVEMSSLISNVSELNSTVFDNSTVKRMITETATNVFGNNESTLSVKDGELSARDLEQSVVINEQTDDVPDNESSKEKESKVINDKVYTSDNVNLNLDGVTNALVEELLNLSKASVNRDTQEPVMMQNENCPASDLSQDPVPQPSVNIHHTASIDHEEVVSMIVDDTTGDMAIGLEVPEILHHEEVVPMTVDDKDDQDEYQEHEDHTVEAKMTLSALDASNDEPPPLFSTVNFDDLQPPVLSPHPSALETLTSPYTQSSAPNSSKGSADDIPDLISPLYSLKPPALSPHPVCLEKLKSADKEVENTTYLLTSQLMPAVDFPQEMPAVDLPAMRAIRDKPTLIQNKILSAVTSSNIVENTEPESEKHMDLTCYELHDQENIPVSTQSQRKTTTFTANQFSPSYLSSSQLLWSPTPVTGTSPQPQVLSNRKSIKRPRKLVFDSNHDQSSKPPVPKRATPSKKQNERKEKSSATLTQMAKKTSSIGKLSQLISPRKSPHAPVFVSSTSVEIETPTETPVLIHDKSFTATPLTSSCAIQTSLSVQPRSAVPAKTVTFQEPSTYSMTSVQGPVSAGPVIVSSEVKKELMFQHESGNTMMQASTQQGVIDQSSQQFFGSDFVPTYTMERNSSVFWKQYQVGSMTYTRDVSLPVTTPDNQMTATNDVRNTPEGSENTRHHYTSYRIQASQVQQYLTSTPVSTNATSRARVQENRPMDGAARVNAPVSTALQATQSDYTRPAANGHEETENFSFFDHLTNSVRDQVNQRLAQRMEQVYGDVVQTDMLSHGEVESNSRTASSGQRRSLPLNYQQTLGPMSQQNYLQEGNQNVNQLNQGTTSSQPVNGYEQNYLQSQQTEMAPDTFSSSLLPPVQHLKPYTISGWISSSYLQALIQRTNILNDMFDHALNWEGDVEDWVIENCKKSSASVLARDLVFRLMTLEELERSIIWKDSLRSMPRTRLAAIRRCLKKQFPKSFNNREWRECLAYIKSSVNVLFKYRVPQVQNFWLMHQISNM